MIKELFTDLVNRIAAVPEFEGRVGAAVGGTSQDPELTGVPVPFAWVIFAGCQGIEPERGAAYQQVLYNFTVVVGIKYGTELDLLNTDILVLEKVPEAVLGITPYKYADEWNYNGCFLDGAQSDRFIYKLNFSVVGHQVPGQTP